MLIDCTMESWSKVLFHGYCNISVHYHPGCSGLARIQPEPTASSFSIFCLKMTSRTTPATLATTENGKSEFLSFTSNQLDKTERDSRMESMGDISKILLENRSDWWYPTNVNNILKLRCAKYNGTFDRIVTEH